MTKDNSYFFCGIGGSGMLPLATILRAQGANVAGSDRALDQGRSEDKFDWLRARGVTLFAQDGSGLAEGQTLIASAAIEDTVPDIAAAKRLGCERLTRAQLLARLFNAAELPIAVGGTSGKSTVTGMTGWILADCDRDPTVMNGAVMKNFLGEEGGFASARVGTGAPFVSEVDESDGSIALFDPYIAVLTNISLDHKSMDELRDLFGEFARRATHVIWNADDRESAALIDGLQITGVTGFGFSDGANFRAVELEEQPLGSRFTLDARGKRYPVTLQVPGRHNIANALAALAAAEAAGVPIEDAVAAIGRFEGLRRRFDVVGTAGGVTVIDDFGHNPEKIAATLRTLKTFAGRLLVFFQPHGYGPLRIMGDELAAMFAAELDADDRLFLCDPVYFGGTTDRSVGSADITARIEEAGGPADYVAEREEVGKRLVQLAENGDRIVIMGARDDTLIDFAQDLIRRIEARD